MRLLQQKVTLLPTISNSNIPFPINKTVTRIRQVKLILNSKKAKYFNSHGLDTSSLRYQMFRINILQQKYKL